MYRSRERVYAVNAAGQRVLKYAVGSVIPEAEARRQGLVRTKAVRESEVEDKSVRVEDVEDKGFTPPKRKPRKRVEADTVEAVDTEE